MGAREESTPCWTGDCDGCGESLSHEEMGTVHCATEADLQTYARDVSWTVTETSGLFCESCTRTHVCEKVGHLNPKWLGNVWYCERCDDVFDAPPPIPAPTHLKAVES